MAGLAPRPQPGTAAAGGASAIQPYMRLVGNRELQEREDERREEAEKALSTDAVRGLTGYLQERWTRAKSNKEEMQRMLLRQLRQFKGDYDPDILSHIRATGGSEIFMLLTQVKCRAASAWLKDVLLPAGDKAWRVSPTPIADLPPEMEDQAKQLVHQEVMAQFQQSGRPPTEEQVTAALHGVRDRLRQQMMELAQQAAESMERRMDDQLEEGNWHNAFSEFIDDLVLYSSGFIKGPVMRKRKRLVWKTVVQDGRRRSVPVVEDKVVKEWERRSPFDIYPSPAARNVQEGYLFDRYRLDISEIQAMKGVPGYNDDVIDTIVERFGRSGYREWLPHDHERATLETRPDEYLEDAETIEALNFWGKVPGNLLMEWDPSGKTIGKNIDPNQSYDIEAWMVAGLVFKAVINPDPLGRRPYSGTSYIRRPGHFWGMGIAEAIEDDQAMLNSAARSLSNNMGIASGPQVAVNDTSRLPAGEDVTSLHPWKIWQFGPDRLSPTGNRKPIEFFQPDSMVRELLTIFDHFSRAADEHASIPAYVYGGTERVQGAGKTASGLAMLMGQASKGMKLVMTNIDRDVIKPRMEALYYHNMLFDPDESIKGDLIVKARGSSALLVREQRQIRLNEFMALVGGNDMALGILGPRGFATLLREAGKDLLDIPVERVVPPDEVMEQKANQPAPDPLEQQKLALEQQQAEERRLKEENRQSELALKRDEMMLEDQRERDKMAQDRELKLLEMSEKRDEANTEGELAREEKREEAAAEEMEAYEEENESILEGLASLSQGGRDDDGVRREVEGMGRQVEAVSKRGDQMGATLDRVATRLEDSEKSATESMQKLGQLLEGLIGRVEDVDAELEKLREENKERKGVADKLIERLASSGSEKTRELLKGVK